MSFEIDNGFFHQDLCGLNVLIFVPHEDDEINTCGVFLKILSKCNAEITLVYTTNGDWKYSAITRMKEARASAEFLGVGNDHIIFLGYGDSISNEKHNHIFYADKSPAKSAAGFTETYGTKLYLDYSYLKNKKHHTYIRSNYLTDIISVIETIRASLIICTDFDEHPDHRMLSLLFDQAVGIVRKKHPDYHPEVWKRFAYSLAYTAVPDYYPINNPETKRPTPETTDKYSLDIIDKSIYSWDDRIRIPVPYYGGGGIQKEFLAQALLKHKSQGIITHSDRIINSDEVYWKRRTDSLSFNATILTSSGIGSYLNDYILYSTNDIDSLIPEFSNYFWHPDDGDVEKCAQFTWDNPQHIEQAVFYSSIDPNSKIIELELQLSDGFRFTAKDIPNDGSPYSIELGPHDNIISCVIRIVAYKGSKYGLSECEFFADSVINSPLKPFVKIMCNDNFIYEYIIDDTLDSVSLDAYPYNIESNQLQMEITKGNSKIINGQLIFDPGDREIVVRCKSSFIDVWDQILIKRLNKKELSLRKKEFDRDNAFIEREKKKLKLHNMLYILKNDGLSAVANRTVTNIIRPRLRKLKHESE